MDAARLLLFQQAAASGDRQAREDLSGYLVGRISGIIETELRGVGVSIVNDAVEDAVLFHLDHPAAYKPSLARLDTFLTRSAKWRVYDALRRDEHKRSAEQSAAEGWHQVLGSSALGREGLDGWQPWTAIAQMDGDLTDAQWAAIQPLVVPAPRPVRRGRRPDDPRAVFNAVLWHLRKGTAWRLLPNRYPPFQSCHRNFRTWWEAGVLKKALQRLAEILRHEQAGG